MIFTCEDCGKQFKSKNEEFCWNSLKDAPEFYCESCTEEIVKE